MNPQITTTLPSSGAIAWLFHRYRIEDEKKERQRKPSGINLTRSRAAILLIISQHEVIRSDQIVQAIPKPLRKESLLRRDFVELSRHGLIIKTGRRLAKSAGEINASIYKISEYGKEQLDDYMRYEDNPLEVAT